MPRSLRAEAAVALPSRPPLRRAQGEERVSLPFAGGDAGGVAPASPDDDRYGCGAGAGASSTGGATGVVVSISPTFTIACFQTKSSCFQ